MCMRFLPENLRHSARMAVLIGAAFSCAAPGWAAEIQPEALDRLPESDVIILGEIHDNPLHHDHQARALSAIRPAAVVFEMLTPEQSVIVNQTGKKDAALAEAIGWAKSGWPDWAIYAPVFAALGEARVYGAALPRETVRAAVTDGAAAQFAGDPARFGLTRPLNKAEQAEREAAQMSAHCDALPESLLPGMVEAQRLRDAAFAETTLRAIDETGGPVVVIAGSGHARTDWGVPVALLRAAPDLRVLSLGQMEGAPDQPPPFDLWLVTEAAPRGDPCAGFAAPAKGG